MGSCQSYLEILWHVRIRPVFGWLDVDRRRGTRPYSRGPLQVAVDPHPVDSPSIDRGQGGVAANRGHPGTRSHSIRIIDTTYPAMRQLQLTRIWASSSRQWIISPWARGLCRGSPIGHRRQRCGGVRAGEVARYRIHEDKSTVLIKVAEVGESKEQLLEAFGECQGGQCSCPTNEYDKLESMEVEPGIHDQRDRPGLETTGPLTLLQLPNSKFSGS